MAEAISRGPFTAEAWVRLRSSARVLCGGQSGIGTVFSSRVTIFSYQKGSTNAPQLSSNIDTRHCEKDLSKLGEITHTIKCNSKHRGAADRTVISHQMFETCH